MRSKTLFMEEELFIRHGPIKYASYPGYITAEIAFVIYEDQKGLPGSSAGKQFQDCIDASSLSMPLCYLSKAWGWGTSKGIPASDQLSGRLRGDKKQALEWYLLSAKCFLNTVQYTGKDMVHAPWGYHLNRTDEMRHNWLNSYSVLMTSLWEPKSSWDWCYSPNLNKLKSVLWRAWHRQPIRRESSVFVITASRIQSLTRQSLLQ